MKDILTTAKAAELLGVSIRTAQLWVESGQLPSWKTPGGHRRIPRQAVLDLIEESAHAPPELAAHAVVFAGKGRMTEWISAGLPGLGLLLDVAEDIESVRAFLAFAPPTLLIVENAEEAERRKFVASLGTDVRYRQSLIITASDKDETGPAIRGAKHVHMRMLPDVAGMSAEITAHLRSRPEDQDSLGGFPLPWNEKARLEAVARSGLLRSEPDERYNRLVRLAAYVARTPMAMFTLISEDQQWFKARVGFDGADTTRDWAFCNETLVANEFTVIEDMSRDKRLEHNPTIQEPYGFRFYAGAPVRDPLGFALGSICVIDVVPRTLNREEREALVTIAEATSNLIRMKWMEDRGSENAGR